MDEDQAAHPTIIERARQAAGRGEWREAYDLLAAADANAPLTGSDLELFADTAYAAGHVDATIEAWERAHASALAANDRVRAAGAAVKVALHLLFDTALLAPIRGWTTRAERLLDGAEADEIRAWIAVARSYERLLSGDFEAAADWAQRAITVGAQGNPAAAAMGRVAHARARILDGDVADGLNQLNEAAVAAVSGELDPLTTGIVYCEVVCALQAIAQYDLADQWTEAMERWRHGHPVGSMHGRCRLHRAEILRLRGRCAEAEQEALRACEELQPYLRREQGWPITELGRIRLRRGDLPGAEEAFVAAQAAGWAPQPGLALLRLAQGDAALALASIREALEHPLNVPSKELPPNTDLRRAPLLEAQVEIELAAGEIERAASAAAELGRIAAAFDSAALRASAALSEGRVLLHTGEHARAVGVLETAARQWDHVNAPYEAALARLLLADALQAGGMDARAAAERSAALSTFERIGARPCAARSMPERQPAQAPARAYQGNTLSLEGDYWSVAFDGDVLRLRDAKGMRYLARLLADPGREFHVIDLVVDERGADLDASGVVAQIDALQNAGDAGEMLDRRAKEAYRRRLAEIDQDLEDARQRGDTVRAEAALADRHFLARELARAVGLGGRDRRVGSAAERARASVTRAVRHAMSRIRAHHPALGKHLDRTIRTGTYCAYLPDPRARTKWVVRVS
jgi:tetratricopeptide (TPR) repeat protein